jgi:hypothetical protein
MHHPLGLPGDRRTKARMPVPEVVAPPRPSRIEHALPVGRDQPGPLGPLHDEERTPFVIFTRRVRAPKVRPIEGDQLVVAGHWANFAMH